LHPLHVFMVWYIVEHRDNLNFTLYFREFLLFLLVKYETKMNNKMQLIKYYKVCHILEKTA